MDKTSKKWVSEKEISVMMIAEDARDYICSRPSVVNSVISVSKVHPHIPAERRARSEWLRHGVTPCWPARYCQFLNLLKALSFGLNPWPIGQAANGAGSPRTQKAKNILGSVSVLALDYRISKW